MDYSQLADFYNELEATSSRLEMTDILVRLIRTVPPGLLGKITYLTLGKLAPDYRGIEFGIAEKLVIKALSFTTGFGEKEVMEIWHKKGDPGDAAEELLRKKRQRSLFATPLTVERVYSTFLKLAQTSGKGTQDIRMKFLAELLHDAQPLDGRYIVRTVIGKLRLGVADMTVIDALTVHYLQGLRKNGGREGEGKMGEGQKGEEAGEQLEEKGEVEITVSEKKDIREVIEGAYNIHPDIGYIAEVMVTKGLDGIKEVGMEPGIPVRAMLAERLSTPEAILEKMGGEAAFEYKYDGIRIQAHIDRENIRLFTRQQEDATSQFPDVVEALQEIRGENEMIVEGECVPVDINTGEMLPFQMVSRRRGRKYGLEEAVEEFPVVLFLFDILYLNGKNLIHLPFPERRQILEENIKATGKVRLSSMKTLSDPKEVERFFLEALDSGCEGLLAKSITPFSIYRAGARGWLWIKFKRDYRSELADTLDLTVVGGFYGRGRRAGAFGALLMAAYNPEKDMFETVCKLGSGFDDAFLDQMNSMFNAREKSSPRLKSEIKADVWFEPEKVFEVLAAEITLSPVHTCAWGVLKDGTGIAVRFPRFT
ncbi:MAG: ATP-dependent DNA ligase, partial [Thermoplasmata archaeon]|nr:ATP-dependent DNA ligase [Thermoplasmata archaeon]